MKRRFFTVCVAFLQILVSNAQSASISISARFNPDEVDINDEVRYIVEVTNAFPQDLRVPSVSGLRRRGESVYQSSTMVNGVTSQKTSFIFSFIPERTGVIEIPEYPIEINGEEYPVPPAKVRIVNDPGAAPQQQNQEISAGVELGCTQAYVGQKIPATVSIKAIKSMQLQNPVKIQIGNDAFFQSPISKQPRLKSSSDFKILSWDTFITPLKSGSQEVFFRVTCPVQVVRSMGFFSFAEQESVNLSSQFFPLEVIPLAQAPADFSGGIGNFRLKNVRLSSDRALLGEPVTLSLDIEGEGNFSRLQPPEIPSNELWKTFPAKSTFTAHDEYDFRGIKTLEYVIVPQKTGEIPVPDIALTFFNPQAGQFETISTDNAQRKVLVSRSAEALPSDYGGGSLAENDTDSTQVKQPTSPLHILSNDTLHLKTLKPFYVQPWFWLLQMFFAAIAALVVLKTRTPSPAKQTPKWNTKKINALLAEAVKSGNAEQFYKVALDAIAQKFQMCHVEGENRPEQIKQLQDQGMKHLKWLESFLNEADAIAFGRGKIEAQSLDHQWEKLIMFLQQKP
jgi:hypothetical protein